jgi:hypothetical protein
MRRAVALVALAAAATAAALAAAPAASAGPRPGERYDGAAPGGLRIHVVVSDDGTRLAQYFLGAYMRCTDGRRRPMGLIEIGEQPVGIDGQGAFSYASRPSRFRYPNGPRGTVRTTFSGRFDASGDVVSGTVNSRFDSRRVDCRSGDVPFTLHRAGTPNAPFFTDSVSTRPYEARARGLSVRMRPYVPGREVHWIRIRWSARCRGGTLRGLEGPYFVPLHRDDAFAYRDRRRTRLRGGGFTRARVSLTGRFYRADGAYRVRGTWSLVASVVRGGRTVDRCRARVRFRGIALPGSSEPPYSAARPGSGSRPSGATSGARSSGSRRSIEWLRVDGHQTFGPMS